MQLLQHNVYVHATDCKDLQQRWRTHHCRVMSGMASRRPPQKMTTCISCTYEPSVTSHSKSSTSSSELLAFLTTCSLLSFSPCSSRLPTRYTDCILKNLKQTFILLCCLCFVNKDGFSTNDLSFDGVQGRHAASGIWAQSHAWADRSN